MILYHFTARESLHGIGRYGLTVGDVSTDFKNFLGRVGVRLTDMSTADDHGLVGSRNDKTRIRLSVEVADDSPLLHKWTEWANSNCTAETLKWLH
jgi:hypothetical protein